MSEHNPRNTHGTNATDNFVQLRVMRVDSIILCQRGYVTGACHFAQVSWDYRLWLAHGNASYRLHIQPDYIFDFSIEQVSEQNVFAASVPEGEVTFHGGTDVLGEHDRVLFDPAPLGLW
ncbi:MAG: hypothetical protein ACRD6N_01110 [Pyrinomonadaceae bacterium]